MATITLILNGIKEINSEIANVLFENGFDDSTPYSSDGKSFLIIEEENPLIRIEQLKKLGIDAEIFLIEDNKEEK